MSKGTITSFVYTTFAAVCAVFPVGSNPANTVGCVISDTEGVFYDTLAAANAEIRTRIGTAIFPVCFNFTCIFCRLRTRE